MCPRQPGAHSATLGKTGRGMHPSFSRVSLVPVLGTQRAGRTASSPHTMIHLFGRPLADTPFHSERWLPVAAVTHVQKGRRSRRLPAGCRRSGGQCPRRQRVRASGAPSAWAGARAPPPPHLESCSAHSCPPLSLGFASHPAVPSLSRLPAPLIPASVLATASLALEQAWGLASLAALCGCREDVLRPETAVLRLPDFFFF